MGMSVLIHSALSGAGRGESLETTQLFSPPHYLRGAWIFSQTRAIQLPEILSPPCFRQSY